MAAAKQLTPKQEDRRHRILTATRAMVAEHGYEGMVMSQVAESAGVSPTTLYNLYNTKDKLLLEALRELLLDNYQKIGLDSEGPGWLYLLKVVRNGAWLNITMPEYAEAIINTLLRSVPGDSLVKMLMINIQQDFHHSLKAMDKRDELRKGLDLNELATIMLGNYWSSFMIKSKGLLETEGLTGYLEFDLLALLSVITVGQTHVDIQSEIEAIWTGTE